MKVYMYSDGSHITGTYRGRAVTILLTDTSYLGCVVSKGPFVSSSQAELQGFLQGLEYLMTNKIDVTDVVARVDHESLVDLFYRHKSGSKSDVKLSPMWRKVMKLARDINLKVEYFKGHQDNVNCNKACDIIAALV